MAVATTAGDARTPWLGLIGGEWRPSFQESLLIAVGGLLPVAYASPFFVPSWTPRMLLVLMVLPLGLLHVLRAAAQRDLPSRAALAFLAACTVSTLIAGAPLWNLRGGFARESSLVFIGGFFAIWALARSASATARRAIAAAAAVSLAVGALVALVQVTTAPTSGLFQMIGDRPSGLLVNPVYFGAVMAGMAALFAHTWARAPSRAWPYAPAVTGFTAFVHMSGSRGALAGLIVVLAVAVFRSRDRVKRLGIAVASVIGVALGSAMSRSTGGRDTLQRLDRGGDGRAEVWGYALDAFGARPVLGHGLGQFRAAVQTHFEPEFARRYMVDARSAEWPDAHNLVLQYLVVGGLLGTACLLWFAWSVGRRSHGPLAWAFVAIALTWFLQPATLATAPLAALLLGAATDPPDLRGIDPSAPLQRRLVAYAVVLGCVFAGSLFVLDNRLHSALEVGDVDRFTRWAQVAPDDPLVAATTASLQTRFRSTEAGIAWSRTAVDLSPHDAVSISTLAVRLYDGGRSDEAIIAATRALTVDRYNADALRIGRAIAERSGDRGLIALVDEIECELAACR